MHAYDPLLSVFMKNFGIVKFGPLWDRFHSHRVGSALVPRSFGAMLFRQIWGVEKNIVYHFDAEKAHLSMGEVFRAVPALLPPVFESFQHPIPYSEERKLPL